MIDLGLTSGIKDLWQEKLLRDYTLVVEGCEFQVHKVVLASISNYFKSMLSAPFIESTVDKVEVKGISAHIVSKLLEFIYIGEEQIIADDTLGILHSAIYLQMPRVAEFCVKKLMENLNCENCFEVLSAVIEYSFQEDAKVIKKFIEVNWEKVMENFNPKVASYDAMLVLIDLWKLSEWELFVCIKSWISVNYQNRITQVNDLMSRVRFCLIGSEELKSIKQMDIYSEIGSTWQDLVEKAVDYHQLPINQKVLCISDQSAVRQELSPCFFFPHYDVFVYLTLNENKEWQELEETIPGIVEDSYTVCLEVNNFLILGNSSKTTQHWHIFDPRTLKWFKIANMEKSKYGFAMVHHKEHLYTMGGHYFSEVPTYVTEKYSLRDNKWSESLGIPTSPGWPAACVLQDTIYVSGGWLKIKGSAKVEPSNQLYSLNLDSPIPEWEHKAACLWPCGGHKMSVMTRVGEEVLFIVDRDLKLQLYSPSTDQWSTFTNDLIPDYFQRDLLDESVILLKGNSVCILNMRGFGDDGDKDIRHYCILWTIPEKGTVISHAFMADFESSEVHYYDENFGAMLAIPHHNL